MGFKGVYITRICFPNVAVRFTKGAFHTHESASVTLPAVAVSKDLSKSAVNANVSVAFYVKGKWNCVKISTLFQLKYL